MDFIVDEDRKDYLKKLQNLQNKVNPKPYSQEETQQIIKEKQILQGRITEKDLDKQLDKFFKKIQKENPFMDKIDSGKFSRGMER